MNKIKIKLKLKIRVRVGVYNLSGTSWSENWNLYLRYTYTTKFKLILNSFIYSKKIKLSWNYQQFKLEMVLE